MNNKSGLSQQIEKEIRTFLTGKIYLSKDVSFSQADLVNRILIFENKVFPSGKFTKQGKYKYWFDKIISCINAEVKNIDIDTKNFKVKSRPIDETATHIINLKIKDWMRDNGQAEEINAAVEEGSGWGNLLWKKVKKGYERADLKNLYIINQTAETIDETAVIERHEFSQTDLREKSGEWKNIDETIKECGTDAYAKTVETIGNESTTPFYEIYERNGEVCLKDLKEQNGKTVSEGDENKYVLAKVIGAGSKGSGSTVEIKYILFAQELNKKLSDIYKEYHRGRYKGRWWREGLYELLFDPQVRLNQIGNQIAQGLEWASKTIFFGPDKLIVQNVMSDLKNGDYLKTQNIQQLNVRMEGFDQLANEWNRIILFMNDIANSQEVVQGITPPSGTPLGTSQMLNLNANKLFGFLQEKLAIPFSQIFKDWLIPQMIGELKAKDIISLTGNTEIMNRLRTMIVDDWYLKNLLYIPPHTKEIADTLKAQKMEELSKRPQILMNGIKDLFNGFKENCYIDIVGEQSTIVEDANVLASLIGLEADPVRRGEMLDEVLRDKGFDIASFTPRVPPQPVQPQLQSQPQVRQPVIAGKVA